MFEGGHIVLRMMLSPARGVVPPSLYGDSCKVECLKQRSCLITGIPYQGKSLIKGSPLYHRHVYFIVSRHTLKHTMQKFEHINNHRENQRNQHNQRGQGNTRRPLSKLDGTPPQRKTNVTSKSPAGDNQLSYCK